MWYMYQFVHNVNINKMHIDNVNKSTLCNATMSKILVYIYKIKTVTRKKIYFDKSIQFAPTSLHYGAKSHSEK